VKIKFCNSVSVTPFGSCSSLPHHTTQTQRVVASLLGVSLVRAVMEFIQNRVEPWIKDQREKLLGLKDKVSWGPLQWRMKWPWAYHREHKKRIQEEYHRLTNLCRALKADSVSDLQDLLCCMVLSECVYKVSFLALIYHCP